MPTFCQPCMDEFYLKLAAVSMSSIPTPSTLKVNWLEKKLAKIMSPNVGGLPYLKFFQNK